MKCSCRYQDLINLGFPKSSIIHNRNCMTKKEIKDLDKLFSKKVKEEAGEKCEITGNEEDYNDECQLHPHHFVGRRNRATRWYLPNGILLSASKHKLSLWSAHENPEWFRGQMLDIRGKKWLDDVIKQSNKVFKGNYETVLKYLNGEIDNYV